MHGRFFRATRVRSSRGCAWTTSYPSWAPRASAPPTMSRASKAAREASSTARTLRGPTSPAGCTATRSQPTNSRCARSGAAGSTCSTPYPGHEVMAMRRLCRTTKRAPTVPRARKEAIMVETAERVRSDLPPAQELETLTRKAESFLYHEAALLDGWRLDEWLALMAPDAHYRVPPLDLPAAAPGEALYLIDDDRQRLESRVRQLTGKTAWAE